MKFLQNKIKNRNYIYPSISFIVIILFWEFFVNKFQIPSYILPTPTDILKEFFINYKNLIYHTKITLIETLIGLFISVLIAILIGSIMDFIPLLKKCFYPLIYITQMLPIITIAPLLLIWFGFGIKSKIICVILTCFFPILINFMDGLENIDIEYVNLFKIMRASKLKTFIHLKFPMALDKFFTGLKISSTYAFIAAVVAEWLGGSSGLGVYMVRAKSSYQLDRVFACNIIIVIFSLLFIKLIRYLKIFILKKE